MQNIRDIVDTSFFFLFLNYLMYRRKLMVGYYKTV